MHNNSSDLIKYRVEQSKKAIDEVKVQIDNELFAIAINRIYYGMFYMLLALSLKEGFRTSKHLQLIGWFNKEFIRTGKVEVELGKIINRAYENRADGDYGVFVEFEKHEVDKRYNDMKIFISEIEKLITE